MQLRRQSRGMQTCLRSVATACSGLLQEVYALSPAASARQGRYEARAPTRSGCCSLCGSAARLGLVPQLRLVARRLRTRSIARREARTIATCSKSAPPCTLAPRRRRPTGPARQGLRPQDRGWQSEQPDPNADSRGLRDPQRPRRQWVSRPSAAFEKCIPRLGIFLYEYS